MELRAVIFVLCLVGLMSSFVLDAPTVSAQERTSRALRESVASSSQLGALGLARVGGLLQLAVAVLAEQGVSGHGLRATRAESCARDWARGRPRDVARCDLLRLPIMVEVGRGPRDHQWNPDIEDEERSAPPAEITIHEPEHRHDEADTRNQHTLLPPLAVVLLRAQSISPFLPDLATCDDDANVTMVAGGLSRLAWLDQRRARAIGGRIGKSGLVLVSAERSGVVKLAREKEDPQRDEHGVTAALQCRAGHHQPRPRRILPHETADCIDV